MDYLVALQNQLSIENPEKAEGLKKQVVASNKLADKFGCTFIQAMQAFNFVLHNPSVHPGKTWSEKAEKELRRRKIIK